MKLFFDTSALVKLYHNEVVLCKISTTGGRLWQQ